MSSYYGLFMWLPELYKRMNENEGSICVVKHHFKNVTLMNQTESFMEELFNNKTCVLDDGVYMASFFNALAQAPPIIFTIFLIDYTGRNKMTVISFIVSAFFVLGIIWIQSRTQGVILTSIFGGVNTITFNSFGATATEVYPTKLRSTAMGVRNVFGRLGKT
jgi:MFS family permease